MRRFSHYLYESFDPDAANGDPGDPRRFLTEEADGALSYIAQQPAGACGESALRSHSGSGTVDAFISGGIIRTESGRVYFDTPVFLREDANILAQGIGGAAEGLADRLADALPEIRRLAGEISNGSASEVNLYHVLCGMVFDGAFFDAPAVKSVVTTSRAHASGLDYLCVLYEKCPSLNAYSDGLLCSWNRFTIPGIALQSFGDADGDRHDLYRFFRLREAGPLPDSFLPARELLRECGNIDKSGILRCAAQLAIGGSCPEPVERLLTHFGYFARGKAAVPVYTAGDGPVIRAIADVTERSLADFFAQTLERLAETLPLTALRHHVNRGEVANELYHILFGSLNAELIRRGIVAEPPYIPGEGRYLKSIQLF